MHCYESIISFFLAFVKDLKVVTKDHFPEASLFLMGLDPQFTLYGKSQFILLALRSRGFAHDCLYALLLLQVMIPAQSLGSGNTPFLSLQKPSAPAEITASQVGY